MILNNLKVNIKQKKIQIAILLIIFTYLWSNISKETYYAFFLGVISTLTTEAYIVWIYLSYRINNRTGQKLTIELAKIHIREIFGDSIGVDYNAINRGKKKPYHENNRIKPLFHPEIVETTAATVPTIGFGVGGGGLGIIDNQRNKNINNDKSQNILTLTDLATDNNVRDLISRDMIAFSQLESNTYNINNNVGNVNNNTKASRIGGMLVNNFTNQLNDLKRMIERPNAMNSNPNIANTMNNNGGNNNVGSNFIGNSLSNGNNKMDMLNREKPGLLKFHKRAFKNHINEFINILNMIIYSEQNYGKTMNNIGTKKSLDLFIQTDITIFNTDYYENHTYNINELNYLEKQMFDNKFNNVIIKNGKFYLPDWKDIKQTINLIGQIHVNCSKYLTNGAIGIINMMNVEYDEKCKSIKNEKKLVIKQFDEAYTNLSKISIEYDNIQKQLEVQFAEYQDLMKKKEETSIILKQEMKVRLLKGNLDNVKNKLADCEDKVKECRIKIYDINQQIKSFLKTWKHQRESVCQHTLRTVITIFEENFIDVDKAVELLITNFNDIVNQYKGDKKLFTNKDDAIVKDSFGNEPNPNTKSIKNTTIKKSILFPIENFLKEDTSPLTIKGSLIDKGKSTRDSIRDHILTEEARYNLVLECLKYHNDEITKRITSYQTKLQERIKNNKAIQALIKNLIESETQYIKDKFKFLNSNMLKLETGDDLLAYWKIFQDHFITANKFNENLVNKLMNFDKKLTDLVKNKEKDLKNLEITINTSTKRFLTLIKNLEKDIEKLVTASKKKEIIDLIPSSIAKHINTERPLVLDEVFIQTEKDLFHRDMDSVGSQFEKILVDIDRDSIELKKDIIIGYLENNDKTKGLLRGLIHQVDTKLLMLKSKSFEDYSPHEYDDHFEFQSKFPELIPKIDEINGKNDKIKRELQEILDAIEMENIDRAHVHINPLFWFNRLFGVFVTEWSKSSYFKKKIMKAFHKAFNKKRTKYLTEIIIKDFIIDPIAPEIRKIYPLPADQLEFLYDCELSLRSKILIEIETQVVINILNSDKYIPLSAKVLIKSFNGRVRICFVPSEFGRSWFSFIGEPTLNMVIDPLIGENQYSINNIPQVNTIITELINKKLKKMIFPYRKELDLPLAFKD